MEEEILCMRGPFSFLYQFSIECCILILQALKVTMKKHPSCFKLEGVLATLNEMNSDKPVTLYKGWVAHLLT